MRIGISTASFFQKRMTEDAFEQIHNLGIPVCEVFLGSYSEYLPDFIDLLLTRKGSTEIKSVHTLNQQYEPDLFNPVERARKDCEFVLDKVARAAGKLGAPYYTFHGPAMRKRIAYHFDYEKIGRRLEEICAFVRERSGGVTELCYENVHWCNFSTPDYFTNLLPYAPSVKACLDVKQALQSDFLPKDYIKVMGERLTNVHLCDYNNGHTALPGKGGFDFTSFFDDLLSAGYTGDGLTEVYPQDYQSFDELARSIDYLNECLYKVQR